MIQLPGGILVFPRKGPPPKPPEGYEIEKGDPYVLRPSFSPCKHREVSNYVLPCGKIRSTFSCSLKLINVNTIRCEECEEVNK